MTNEQLQKGSKLSLRIKDLERELNVWSVAKSINDEKIRVNVGDGRKMVVYTSFIDFDVLKTATISTIEKELNQLRSEFENL